MGRTGGRATAPGSIAVRRALLMGTRAGRPGVHRAQVSTIGSGKGTRFRWRNKVDGNVPIMMDALSGAPGGPAGAKSSRFSGWRISAFPRMHKYVMYKIQFFLHVPELSLNQIFFHFPSGKMSCGYTYKCNTPGAQRVCAHPRPRKQSLRGH
jgi:hypothetical protein